MGSGQGSENETRGLQKPKRLCSGVSCTVFHVSCVTAGAGVVFEMAGDGKWTGGSEKKMQGL